MLGSYVALNVAFTGFAGGRAYGMSAYGMSACGIFGAGTCINVPSGVPSGIFTLNVRFWPYSSIYVRVIGPPAAFGGT